MKKQWDSVEKKQMIIFSLIAFGMPVIMGILMGISFYAGNDLELFPITHMFYPAAGVALALLLVRKEDEARPKKFYIGYLIMTGIMIAMTIASVLLPSASWVIYANYICMIGSVIAFVLILVEKKEVRKEYELGIKGRPKSKPWLYVILFFVLYMARIIVSSMIEGTGQEMITLFSSSKTWILIGVVVLNFFLTYIIFFGEEYGWRYFLQPMLQKRFGLRTGVILLGVLWGLWHLPINLFYYSPETALQSILVQQITCISLSIFMAWAYMKTQNIWVPILMHFINNNMAVVFSGGNMEFSNQVIGWNDVGILLVMNVVAFSLFIFSKEFKEVKDA